MNPPASFSRQLLYPGDPISTFFVYTRVLLFLWRSKSFCGLETFYERKSPWVKTKAKTGPKSRKVVNFGMKRRKFSRTVTRARGLISLHRSAKRNLEMNSVVLHPKVWWESVEKNNGNKLARRKKGFEKATSKHKPGLNAFQTKMWCSDLGKFRGNTENHLRNGWLFLVK